MILESKNARTRAVIKSYTDVIPDQELARTLASLHLRFTANYFPIPVNKLLNKWLELGFLSPSIGLTVYDQSVLLPRVLEVGLVRPDPKKYNTTSYSKNSVLVFRGLAFINGRDFSKAEMINQNPSALVDKLGESLGEHSLTYSLFYPLPIGGSYQHSNPGFVLPNQATLP